MKDFRYYQLCARNYTLRAHTLLGVERVLLTRTDELLQNDKSPTREIIFDLSESKSSDDPVLFKQFLLEGLGSLPCFTCNTQILNNLKE